MSEIFSEILAPGGVSEIFADIYFLQEVCLSFFRDILAPGGLSEIFADIF